MTIADSVFPMDNVASCIQLPPEEENRIVSELIKESELNLKEGNLYYVISNRSESYFFYFCCFNFNESMLCYVVRHGFGYNYRVKIYDDWRLRPLVFWTFYVVN